MKTIGVVVLSIWLGGALILSGFYVLSDRKECINDEGIIKGILWCENQPKTQMGQSTYIFSNFIRGALWPIHAAGYFANDSTLESRFSPPQSDYSNPSEDNAGAYSCRQMMSDINEGDNAAKRRMMRHLQTEIFSKDDRRNELRLRAIATDYYGHDPSTEELRQFSAESLRLAIGACMFNPDMTVKEAYFLGANTVVPGKFSK